MVAPLTKNTFRGQMECKIKTTIFSTPHIIKEKEMAAENKKTSTNHFN